MSAKTDSYCKLLVFAKAPVAGQVKTRLIPLLGAEGAAGLHEQLTRHALATALAARIGAVELWGAPSPRHAFFKRCAQEFGISLHAQSTGDLGERMFHAFEKTLRSKKYAVITGSDCPTLTVEDLQQAAEALKAGNDAVFCPAEDGGYVLIGLSLCSPLLFQDVVWSSPLVLQQTRVNLRKLNWRWRELDTLWDVDRPEDYHRLAELPGWNLRREAAR
ncbi:MAG: TIGR04282 family arsenosugar biosynthesis glycosyltransferase [Burkholderiales bacterium]